MSCVLGGGLSQHRGCYLLLWVGEAPLSCRVWNGPDSEMAREEHKDEKGTSGTEDHRAELETGLSRR